MCVEDALLDDLVNALERQREQFVEQAGVLACVPCRLAGLEQERYANRDLAVFERRGDLLTAVRGQAWIREPCPRRVIEEQPTAVQERDQQVRQTWSAAPRSTGMSLARTRSARRRQAADRSSRWDCSCASFAWAPRITSSPS